MQGPGSGKEPSSVRQLSVAATNREERFLQLMNF